MTFTAKEVQTALRELDEFIDGYSSVGYFLSEVDDLYLPEIGEFVLVDSYHRSVTNPSIIWAIIKHAESGRLFGVQGYYSSWDGVEWESTLVEIEAYEYKTTDYKEKR